MCQGWSRHRNVTAQVHGSIEAGPMQLQTPKDKFQRGYRQGSPLKVVETAARHGSTKVPPRKRRNRKSRRRFRVRMVIARQSNLAADAFLKQPRNLISRLSENRPPLSSCRLRFLNPQNCITQRSLQLLSFPGYTPRGQDKRKILAPREERANSSETGYRRRD